MTDTNVAKRLEVSAEDTLLEPSAAWSEAEGKALDQQQPDEEPAPQNTAVSEEEASSVQAARLGWLRLPVAVGLVFLAMFAARVPYPNFLTGDAQANSGNSNREGGKSGHGAKKLAGKPLVPTVKPAAGHLGGKLANPAKTYRKIAETQAGRKQRQLELDTTVNKVGYLLGRLGSSTRNRVERLAGDLKGLAEKAETHRQLPIAQAAPAAPARPLVLMNPAENRGDIKFLLNGEVHSLKPGQSQTLVAGKTGWTLEFHRGGHFGATSYRLTEGTYKFTVTPNGWDLFEDASRQPRD